MRAELKRRRRAIALSERTRLADAIAHRALRDFPLPSGARVGIYLSAGSEVATAPLIALARRRRWRLFVPVLRGEQRGMWFLPLAGPMRINRHGIAEPVRGAAAPMPPRWLDLAFVPLVGFTSDGQRLGSGAAYYDRTFAYRLHREHWRKPRLVGLAYECQHIDRLERQPWDVPLDAVITERGTWRFRGACR